MRSKNQRPLFSILLFVFMLSLTSCEQEKELQFPLAGGIPQSEIVFMPDTDPVHLKQITDVSKTLSFIGADGSNLLEFTFTLSGGSNRASVLSDYETRYVYHPRWSTSGDELVFYIRDQTPNMRVIGVNGKMYGQDCVDIGAGGVLTFDLHGRIFIEIKEDDLLYEDYKDMAEAALIARYDMKSCKIISVFSVPAPFSSLRGAIQESNNGLLVAAFYDPDIRLDAILLYNQTTGDSQTLTGYHPSLTEDGALLAYYNMTGALVVRDMKTGTEQELLYLFPANDDWPPRFMSMPGWSPDHQWLVYNTPEGEIFKINVETGENIYLTYGWAPDWR